MQLKKLIKMYNEKFGDTLGVIDDDFNKEQMYRIYYFIKNDCDDKDIQERLSKIKLDKPKTLEQQLTKLESENGNTNEMHNPYQNLKPFMTNGNFAYFDITNLKVGAYTPTNVYNPATKKYVDDTIASQPQFSFNESGELVVTINGVSKTFVPKAE